MPNPVTGIPLESLVSNFSVGGLASQSTSIVPKLGFPEKGNNCCSSNFPGSLFTILRQNNNLMTKQ